MDRDRLNASGLARDTADAVARRSYGKLVAFLAADLRDVAAAEDALSEAFAAALSDWPRHGCPANPEAWLLTVARRRGIDGIRKHRRGDRVATELQVLMDEHAADELHAEATIPDKRLGLLFACAHPAINANVRAPLMLQTILGFDAKAIASAFLMSPDAMGKRLGRAKQKIRAAGIPLAIPTRDELADRLQGVLDAIYAAFAEAWSDPDGADTLRRDLSEEAIYLARLTCELLPQEPEALGLLAGMLYAEARRTARRDREGNYVPLAQQDLSRWNALMIDEAESVLRRAGALGRIGRYQLEAALQSAHVERRRTGRTDWHVEVTLYDALLSLSGSPVVALNRALAVAERDGAAAGLELLDVLQEDERMSAYQPYWAARAALLGRLERQRDADHAYDLAVGLARDPAVRRFLQQRQRELLDLKLSH